jgi:hypothetical protein
LLIIAAAAVLPAVAAVFFTRLPCLVLRRSEGRIIALFPLERLDPGFAVSYLHSVARLPAVEYFRPGPGGTLELYRTDYRGLGAGLPFGEEGGAVRLQDGWIVIEGLARRFRRVSLSPMPLTEHRLRVNGREIDLVSLAGGRTITLSIERKSLVRRLVLGRRMGYIKP